MLEALTGSVDPADASTQQRLRESVSPAFAAILNKCVEPDSASRYPSAAELLADLECQANHRPLIHQPEPSMKERLAKWVKRHPRLSSSGTLFTLFALILATGAAGWVSRSRQLAGYAAEAKFDSFEEAVPKACSLLTVYRDDGGSVEEGLERISTLLKSVGTDGRYRVDSLLDDTNQRQQRNRIGQLLYYEARGHALLSKMTTNAAERESELQVARAKNQDATVWFKSEVGRVPAALRAQAARFEGDPMPDAPREPADGFPLDRLLYANELIAARRFEAAWRYLDRVKSDFADDVSFWMLLGSSYAAGSKFEKADTCLTASLALNPTSWVALSDRGLARMALRQFEDAEQDFSQVVKLRPKYWGGYLNRALARAGQRKFQGAVDDLSLVIEFNGPTRAIFLRSRYRSVLGDKEGATADRQLGLTTIPSDEKSWVSRGLAVMRQDPKKALSDFREAIALNPLSVNGWRNVAHVLSERLSDSQGAIEALNKIIESGFDDAGAFAGRAVLYARDGRENEAVEDIGKALSLDSEPMTKYQAACVYALLSKEKPSHRKRSVSLLAASIPQLPRVLLQLAPRDPDLANVRNDENYRQLMESSRQLFQLQKR
ncbi:MAG: tetratricopeptide repeat protein, partial [Planctomycetaceae bacterium]